VRLCLARGSVAPSSGIPPRSGAERPLERGPVSIESRAPPRASLCLACGHHGPAASIPAPPAGAFNALTFAGAQVKGESTPLRAWESHPGTAPPTPLVRPSPPLCDAMRRGQQQLRCTVPPTPVRRTRHTLEKRTTKPSKGGRITTPRPCKDDTVMLGRRDRSPPSPSALCDHPRSPQRHPGSCITIPDAVEACGDGTPPRQLLYPHTASRQRHPRVLTRAVTEQETSTPPPSKPLLDAHRTRHDAPPDARLARTSVYSATLYTTHLHVDEIVRHACKLSPPWPIKGGAVPWPQGDGEHSLSHFPP
jgi:hypothetical protein